MTGSYFPHLDGLRAIALFAVLGFHFEVPYFSGGYVGVDCFFVLSSYLMTRNIAQSAAAGKFSLREFYVRRIWRLLPASMATALCSLVGAFAFFSPSLAMRAGKSAVASLFSVSNLYFWMQGNYFDTHSNEKPLLHTWSLSVEEQFYIVYPPVLLYLLTKFRRDHAYLQSGIIVCTILSVISCMIAEARSSSFAFYSLPTRAFGFGLGALLYVFEEGRAKGSLVTSVRQFSNASAALGLALVLASIVKLHGGSHIVSAIPGSLGFMLLIVTPQSWISTTVLCNPLMQMAGLLSYSAYLAHWPLYVYLHLLQVALPSEDRLLTNPVLLTILTFVLAALLRASVEQPFRARRPTRLLVALAVAVLCLAGSSFNSGWKFRSADAPNEKYQILQTDFAVPVYTNVAKKTYTIPGKKAALPRTATPYIIDGRPANKRYATELPMNASFALVGSSFALHSVGTVYEMVRHGAVPGPVIYFPGQGCTFRRDRDPILSDHGPERGREQSKRCIEDSVSMSQMLASLPGRTTVLIADLFRTRDGVLNTARVMSKVEHVRSLGMSPAILGPPPFLAAGHEYVLPCLGLTRLPVPRELLSWQVRGGCPVEAPAGTAAVDRVLRELARNESVCYESVHDALCTGTAGDGGDGDDRKRMCAVATPTRQQLYTKDNWHLTYEGSLYIGKLMAARNGSSCLAARP